MRLKFATCLAPSLVALIAGTASAEPIRYSTEHSQVPYLGFEGTTGTFEPGSTLSLGRFVIPVPDANAPGSIDGVQFEIQVDAPDFARTIPPSGPGDILTRVLSQVIIVGHFQGYLGAGMPTGSVTAVFDSVKLGGVMALTQDAKYEWTFPVPPGDIQLPPPQMLMIPTDSWWARNPPGSAVPFEQKPFYSDEILVHVTPEPMTIAGWGLVGVGAMIVRRRSAVRRGRTISRSRRLAGLRYPPATLRGCPPGHVAGPARRATGGSTPGPGATRRSDPERTRLSRDS